MKDIITKVVTETATVNLKVGDFVAFKNRNRPMLAYLTCINGVVSLAAIPGGTRRCGIVVSMDDKLTERDVEILFGPGITDAKILEPHEVPEAVAWALGVPYVNSRPRYFVSLDMLGQPNLPWIYWKLHDDTVTVIGLGGWSGFQSAKDLLARLEQPGGWREVPAAPF
ncbi:MAG TPA: hypothetical protein VM008_21345 [Phycisphaerae bacterium]|nr:hypothetical protein [Phycisphaerae bacterium]